MLAAADGTIIKLFQSERGGTTIYQLSTDKKFIYYYAHLDRWAFEGTTRVREGDLLGYVGNTGNARTTAPHLHFGVYARGPRKTSFGTTLQR